MTRNPDDVDDASTEPFSQIASEETSNPVRKSQQTAASRRRANTAAIWTGIVFIIFFNCFVLDNIDRVKSETVRFCLFALITVIPFLLFGGLLLAVPQMFTGFSGMRFDAANRQLRKMGWVLLCNAGFSSGWILLSHHKDVPKPQVEMHRTQAETPGDSGWYRADSTKGSFSIQMPIQFNDFTLLVTEPDGSKKTAQTFGVGGKSAEGIKFSAIETIVSQSGKPADFDKLPESFSNGGGGKLALSNVIKSSIAGCPTIEFTVTGPESGAFVLYVNTPTSLLTVILEYPAAYESDAAQFKSRFFDSLVLKSPYGTALEK